MVGAAVGVAEEHGLPLYVAALVARQEDVAVAQEAVLAVALLEKQGDAVAFLGFAAKIDRAAENLVGEAVARITRTALTLGGAHAIFKTTPIERLFRDGAVGAIQFPPSDFCLSSVGTLELGLDPREVMPPLK